MARQNQQNDSEAASAAMKNNPVVDSQPAASSRAVSSERRATQPEYAGVVDRRLFSDRRDIRVEGQDKATPTGLERRRGPGRRLSDNLRSAEEGELTKEQFLFLMAIDGFKKANRVSFPTWSDVLEVVRLLGYRKTQASQVKLTSAEDWSEAFDAPANVRTNRQIQRQQIAEREAA